MLTVSELMTRSPDTVTSATSLHEALTKMNKDGCRHLPVVDDGRLVGILSDRDVRLAVNSPILHDEQDMDRKAVLDDIKVDACMTANPTTTSPEASAYDAADVLRLYKYGALPVVRDGALVGILSTVDYLTYMAAQGQRE